MKLLLILAMSVYSADLRKSAQSLYQTCNTLAVGEIYTNVIAGKKQDLNSPSIICARSCQEIVDCIGTKDSVGKECYVQLNTCISDFKVATKK